jgi:hypothetical protein
MIRSGDIVLQAPRPAMVMDDEVYSCIYHAILRYINLCQRNGDTELKEATIFVMIKAL